MPGEGGFSGSQEASGVLGQAPGEPGFGEPGFDEAGLGEAGLGKAGFGKAGSVETGPGRTGSSARSRSRCGPRVIAKKS